MERPSVADQEKINQHFENAPVVSPYITKLAQGKKKERVEKVKTPRKTPSKNMSTSIPTGRIFLGSP